MAKTEIAVGTPDAPAILTEPTQADGAPGTEVVTKDEVVITVTRDATGKVVDEVHRDYAGYVVAQLGRPPGTPAHVATDGAVAVAHVTITVDRTDYGRAVSEKQLAAVAKAAGIELPERPA